ncbi:MAG: hypothetical protein MJZ01_04615 [Bacteroidales bacterium]|nr:hypothetical protein [Bacteroidales bacterium]
MDSLLKQLRQFFLIASVPPLAFFALFYFAADESLVNERLGYLLLVLLFLAALVAIPLTHWLLKRAEAKCEDKPEEEQIVIFGKAYRIRIVTMNVLSFLSSLAYFVTVVESCIYMTGMLTILILLSYPSRQYIIREN